MRISVLFVILDFASPFLFWMYVRGLTCEGEAASIPRLRYHLPPIIIGSALLATLAFVPEEITQADLPEDHPIVIKALLITLAIFLGDIVFKIVIGTYLALIIRRLRKYHQRLHEVFASTENRELTWIWAIIFASIGFWLLSVALSVATWGGALSGDENNDLISFFESLALLILLWVIGIWGLRQRPGLIREPVAEVEEPPAPIAKKYEKSALDDERAARIARKIDTAMTTDLLYREPNLSLWDLGKHIGVTSHYISQTLNSHLSTSFFDYINSWRIKDAIEQLNTTDETILVIAYDVGFNSRSAFYKAFKRETGKTPSDLRKG
ncbi:helix-turn-helix domain-containing protein [Aliiroseovarius halocynthiae]|nr:helix-turn-helix transcriptional regulator [Aliiroseovarius halocynthiae]